MSGTGMALPWAIAAVAALYAGLGFQPIRRQAEGIAAGWPGALAGGLVVILPSLALGAWRPWGNTALPAAGLVASAALPLGAAMIARKSAREVSPWDWVALALLWLPAELHGVAGGWSDPREDPDALLLRATSACLAVIVFGSVRRLPAMGYRWRLSGSEMLVAALAMAGLLAFTVPVSLLAGGVARSPSGIPLTALGGGLLAIALFEALPQEVLFRGILLNLLQRRMRGRRGPWPALAVSVALFVAARAAELASPDPWQLLLALLAGTVYGWCYIRTGSLMPGVIAHTALSATHLLILPGSPGP